MKLSELMCGLMLTLSLFPLLSYAAQPAINFQQCYALKGRTIPVEQISLPTQGAEVQTVNWNLFGAYCEIGLIIKPKDPIAPVINVIADFPANWNQRALMLGGGGFDGIIFPPSAPFQNSLLTKTPLAQGFVTFANDSGHAGFPTDGSFAMNDEALNNFAGDALKKTRDAVSRLISAAYGAQPSRWYAIGGSSGGREVLALAQNWPNEWDGIVSWYPAAYIADQARSYVNWTQALALRGGYLGLGERQALHDSVLATCDALDGVQDGIVSNPDACRKIFDPKTAKKANGWPLRCIFGEEDRLFHSCLSDAQINSINVMSNPASFTNATYHGDKDFPGIEWGANFGNVNLSNFDALVGAGVSIPLGLGSAQPTYPDITDILKRLGMPLISQFTDGYIRYVVTRKPTENVMEFNANDPGSNQQRITAMEKIFNMNNSDLTPFFKRGGKLILVQGMADQVVPLQSTRRYYNNVVKAVNTKNPGSATNSIRYYEIPGMGHVVGEDFNGQWDGLTVVQQWVENGTAPADQVVGDLLNPGRTRPLCGYPMWPKYVRGDVNAASSFTCTTN